MREKGAQKFCSRFFRLGWLEQKVAKETKNRKGEPPRNLKGDVGKGLVISKFKEVYRGILAQKHESGHSLEMKAIETTATLDEAARIVPRQPLGERPSGEFRVILLIEEGEARSAPQIAQSKEGLLALARHAEPMGTLSNKEIDRLVYGS